MDNNKTVIEIGEKSLNYYRNYNTKIGNNKRLLIFITTFILLFISVSISCLQYFSWDPLYQLEKFKRIKKNMGNWRKLIEEKEGIEIARGKNVGLKIGNDAYNFKCYDFGLFYSALKLNNSNHLPQFIKRGIGGIWLVKKADKKDLSAKQFCEFLIMTQQNETITCGTDMYDRLGYGGFFEIGNPCQSALNKIETTHQY